MPIIDVHLLVLHDPYPYIQVCFILTPRFTKINMLSVNKVDIIIQEIKCRNPATWTKHQNYTKLNIIIHEITRRNPSCRKHQTAWSSSRSCLGNIISYTTIKDLHTSYNFDITLPLSYNLIYAEYYVLNTPNIGKIARSNDNKWNHL